MMNSSYVQYDSSFSKSMPRSTSGSSKIENLRGFSSKIFGRKGPTTSSERTSPVPSVISSSSTIDDSKLSHSPSQSGPTFYKGPPTPPGKMGVPKGSISSRESSQRLSIATTYSTIQTPPSNGFTDCCFCDIPLQYVLAAEDIVELHCTHLAHFECLLQLSDVLNKNKRDSQPLRLPACGICDEPSYVANPVIQERFNRAMGSLIAVKLVSPISAITTLPDTSLFASPVDQETSQMPFKDCKCTSMGCQGLTSSIQFFAQVDGQEIPESGPASLKCIVGASVSSDKFYQNSYRPSLSQDLKLTHQISKLKGLSFKGVSMERLDMSRLRFANSFNVSSDLCTWSNCTLYLFSGHMVLTTKSPDGQTHIKAIIDTKLHLSSAKILGRERKPHIEIVAKSSQKYKMYLICDNFDVLEALCAALHNEKLNFPVTPQVNDTYSMAIPPHTGEVTYSTPLNLVVCVEQPHTPKQADALIKSFKALRSSMGPIDRLAVVIYGSIVRSFSFQATSSSTWSRVDDALQKLGKPFAKVSLNDSLNAAEELLHNLRIERSLACVMVLSTAAKSELSSISTGFLYSDTPIHTVGIDDVFDSGVLNALASKTDGVFTACSSANLDTRIVDLYQYTHRRTHKNVEIRLTPTEGITISGIQGWKPPFFDSECIDSPGSDLIYSIKPDQEFGQTVPLGSLYEKSYKSVIVSLEIDDCSTLDGGPLLDATLFSRPPQSISHHRCTFSNSVFLPESTKSNGELVKQESSIDACGFARDLCNLLAEGKNKQAFQMTQSPEAKFTSRFSTTAEFISPECGDLVKEHLLLFDQFFDNFSEKLFQPQGTLMSELLNFIWKYSSKNPHYF